jgi:hypothetical protein
MKGKFVISKKPAPPANRPNLTPSPLNGTVPPVETRWQSGQSGNPSGRPKILREESARYLAETDDSGKTNARKLIESMGRKALSWRPDAVSAFRELRQTVETNDDVAQGNGPLNISMLVLKEVYNRAATMTDEKLIEA